MQFLWMAVLEVTRERRGLKDEASMNEHKGKFIGKSGQEMRVVCTEHQVIAAMSQSRQSGQVLVDAAPRSPAQPQPAAQLAAAAIGRSAAAPGAAAAAGASQAAAGRGAAGAARRAVPL